MTVLGDNTDLREIAIPGTPGVRVTLAWGRATDTGRRRTHNEDSLVADAPIFAVADGMGGHAAGDVASDAVVTRLAELSGGEAVEVETIVLALEAATEDISHAIDERDLGVGTTVTGAALTASAGEPQWLVFNVGDSRVYLFDHNVLTRITVDHSVVQELVTAGLISAADAEHHPDSNVVTRAVGFNTEPAPDFWSIPVAKGSRLLLCSDGLTREGSELRLRLHLAADLSARETALALIDAAIAEGGRDNITAIVVDVIDVVGAAEPPESP